VRPRTRRALTRRARGRQELDLQHATVVEGGVLEIPAGAVGALVHATLFVPEAAPGPLQDSAAGAGLPPEPAPERAEDAAPLVRSLLVQGGIQVCPPPGAQDTAAPPRLRAHARARQPIRMTQELLLGSARARERQAAARGGAPAPMRLVVACVARASRAARRPASPVCPAERAPPRRLRCAAVPRRAGWVAACAGWCVTRAPLLQVPPAGRWGQGPLSRGVDARARRAGVSLPRRARAITIWT
jgi:hypothetical protein